MHNRISRRSARFCDWLSSAFVPTFRLGVHFDRPDDDPTADPPAGGNGGGATVPPVAAPSPTSADPRLGEALKERKKARAALRSIVRAMGYDPDQMKIVATGDTTNPYRIDGLPDLDSRTAIARAAAGAPASANGARKPVNSVEVATLQAQVTSLRKQVAGVVDYVKRTAIVEPLRAACVRHNAIDDDGGKYDDVVSQLAPQFRVDVDFDADEPDAKPDVKVYAVDASGSPLINAASNQPATPDSLVSDFLSRRPKYRQANFRSGPGAGGSRVGPNGNRRSGVQTIPDDKEISGRAGRTDPNMNTAKAMSSYFGGRIKPEDLLD